MRLVIGCLVLGRAAALNVGFSLVGRQGALVCARVSRQAMICMVLSKARHQVSANTGARAGPRAALRLRLTAYFT